MRKAVSYARVGNPQQLSGGIQQRPAIGYVRVSTERQATEGVSLDAQRAAIERLCAAKDLTLVGLHADEGISGRRVDRPGLQQAIDAVCQCGGVLVVYSVSRMSRSLRDVFALSDRLSQASCDLVSVSEPIDTTSAMGRAFFAIVAVFAELESDLVGERLAVANATRCELGYRTQGVQPFGFRLGADGRREESPPEQAILGEILQLRREGHTTREIAEILQVRGVPTMSQLRGYRTGKPHAWDKGTVYSLLRRAVPELTNIGFRRHNRPLSAKEIALLGTDTDAAIAARTDRHRPVITRERVRRGIPPFAKRHERDNDLSAQ